METKLQTIKSLMSKGDYQEASEEALKLYMKTKDDKIYNLYGISVFKLNEYDKAYQVFSDLYSRNKNPTIGLNLAEILVKKENYVEANSILKEIIDILPQKARAKELINICETMITKEEVTEVETKEVKAVVDEFREEEVKKEEEVESGKEEEAIKEIEKSIEAEEEQALKEEEAIKEVEKSIEVGREIQVQEERKVEKELKGTIESGRVLEVSLTYKSMIVREDIVTAVSGNIRKSYMKERFRGKNLKELFGSGKVFFAKYEGDGKLLLTTQFNLITVVDCDNELFTIKDELGGFDGALNWENGTLRNKKDFLEIVRLEGTGSVIFLTETKVMKIEIQDIARLSIEKIVAFSNGMVPKLIGETIEFKGSGFIFVMI